ncbi:MAG: RrF2 family transcriptional regulator, partial [Nitrospinota bacterium]
HLQCEPDNEPISGRVLSEKLRIPYRFLEQILSELKRGGLVRSVRGYNGGYKLDLEAESISIYDIYKTIEGRFEPWNCREEADTERCGSDYSLCVINQFYTDFRTTLTELMKGYTLKRLCQTAGRLRMDNINQDSK